MHSPRRRLPAKSIGRFYTHGTTAAFVTGLVLDPHSRTVLDPSCGSGVFLVEAANRLRSLRCDKGSALTGIDLDGEACAAAISVVEEAAHDAQTRIINRDFFLVTPEDVGQVEVLLGNPPFVRYQAFSGGMRKRALKRAADGGVTLSRQSNAWAPFVIHAMSFLRPGGRMGLILPAELLHARYALPVFRCILEQFRHVSILTFNVPLFPTLSIQAIVLVADGAGSWCDDFRILRVQNMNGEGPWVTTGQWAGKNPLADDSGARTPRVSEYCLPPDLRSTYHKVASSEMVRRLGEVMSVDIGYVTGDHDFFHLTEDGIRNWRIPRRFCVRSLRNARGIKGSIFSARDWERLGEMTAASYLFHVPPDTRGQELKRIRPYLAEGMRRGINRRYQCRSRDPWYSVRSVRVPDGFITSMSNGLPRMIVNDAGVTASNSLHVVTRRPGIDQAFFKAVAASWYCSYTIVSTILEGHVLGGGLRKLEPSEAERVLLVVPPNSDTSSAVCALLPEIDKLLRESRRSDISSELDELLLIELAGLNSREVAMLADFADAHTRPDMN